MYLYKRTYRCINASVTWRTHTCAATLSIRYLFSFLQGTTMWLIGTRFYKYWLNEAFCSIWEWLRRAERAKAPERAGARVWSWEKAKARAWKWVSERVKVRENKRANWMVYILSFYLDINYHNLKFKHNADYANTFAKRTIMVDLRIRYIYMYNYMNIYIYVYT